MIDEKTEEEEKRSNDEEELAKRRAEEYEMQLFGFHSRTFSDSIIQKIKENVNIRCRQMHESIEKKYKPEGEQKELLKNNIENLKQAYQNKMQAHFKKIEDIIHKFISVPNNVLLENDKCQATQYSDEEIHSLEKKLEYLQQTLKRATVYNAMLKEELQTLEQMEETERMSIKLCNIIEKGLTAKKLSNKTVRAVEKVEGLTEFLDSLQPQTPKEVYNPSLDESDLEQIF